MNSPWYVSFIMSLVYIFFGSMLLLGILPDIISNSRIIGGVLVAYGIFRLVIALRKRKKYLNDEE